MGSRATPRGSWAGRDSGSGSDGEAHCGPASRQLRGPARPLWQGRRPGATGNPRGSRRRSGGDACAPTGGSLRDLRRPNPTRGLAIHSTPTATRAQAPPHAIPDRPRARSYVLLCTGSGGTPTTPLRLTAPGGVLRRVREGAAGAATRCRAYGPQPGGHPQTACAVRRLPGARGPGGCRGPSEARSGPLVRPPG